MALSWSEFRARLVDPVMNLQELAERLRNEDEITVLELLEIHSDELVDAFLDKLEEKQQEVYNHFL